MTNQTLLARPALTAIAAALALASTPALAQEAVPADASAAPTEAAPVQDTAPIAPQSMAPALPPVVMPTPQASAAPVAVVAPTLPEIATPQRAAAEPVSQAATRAAPAERAAAPVRTAQAAPQVAMTSPPTAQPSQSPVLQSPMLTPSDLRAMEQRQVEAQVTPAPQTAVATQFDNSAYWVIGAGGAALVLGFGGLAFLRRRDRTVDAREDTVLARNRGLSPAVAATPEWTEPVIVARKPVLAADGHSAELEAMIAKRPTIANPFLTRSKRLRRANFILTHDGKAPASFVTEPARVAAPIEERKAAIAAAPAQKEVAKTPAKKAQKEPVFSFAKKAAPRRNTGLKPATT